MPFFTKEQNSKAVRELRTKKFERLKKLIALFLLLLLFAFPLLTLQKKFKQIYDFTKVWSEAENENLLRDEMSEFKSDFDSKSFLTKFLQKNLPANKLSYEVIQADTEDNNATKKQKFADLFSSICAKLNDKELNFKPLFIILSDSEINHVSKYFSKDFLAQKKIPLINADLKDQDFLSRFFLFFSFSGNPPEIMPQNLINSANKFVENHSKTLKQTQNKKYFYEGILSSFVKEEPFPGKVNAYFSDIFNFQNILYYTLPIVSNNHYHGSLTIAYLDKQFYEKKHINSILNITSSNKVKRFFPQNRTLYRSRNQDMVYTEDFSVKLKNSQPLNLKLGVKTPGFENVAITNLIAWIGWAIRIVSLFVFAIFIRILLFNFHFPMPLRWKLISIFFLAISIPAIAGTILFFGISSNHISVQKNLARSHLESSLNMIELAYKEAIDRQVLNNLYFKSKLIENYEIQSLTDFNIRNYKVFFGDNICSSFVYNRKGEYLSTLRNQKRPDVDNIKLTNSIYALNNLSGLINNTKTNKDKKILTLTMGFAHKVLGLFDFSEAAGSEGENIARISDINSLSRSHFFLFPDVKSKFFRPEAIGFFEISTDKQFELLLKSKLEKNPSYLNQKRADCETSIAMAKRDSSEINKEFWLSPTLRNDPSFSRLFQNAMTRRDSGESRIDSPQSVFYGWRFNETIRIIFAGLAKVNLKTYATFYLEFAPAGLFIFCLLALLLVSEIVASLFLTPIKALSQGLKQISETGNFDLNVEIQNNDEFDRLGESFNAMTRGLMLKKHISRFVSERLLNKIENDLETDSQEKFQNTEMTILASDIRDFTTISENNQPELVVEILNNYFTEMEACILSEGGLIDKFIGDAIIAVFSGENDKDSAIRACKAAFKMRKSLKAFNDSELLQKQSLKIENGIGIATGASIAANLGKNYSRKFFTIIGELSDSAEHLESQTKSGSFSKIMIDKNTIKLVKSHFKMSINTKNQDSESAELISEVI